MPASEETVTLSKPLLFPFGKSAAAGGQPPDDLDLSVLGGKGINLCRLVRAGFPVPPGIVLTTAGYREFVAGNNLEERIMRAVAGMKPGDPASSALASSEIRGMFEACEIPKMLAEPLLAAYERLREQEGGAELSVAVRSSATAEDLEEAAFAGQQDTYLNVRGGAALLKAVRACWASLWTARAITYRAHKGFGAEGLALAVVIQKMVNSDASGVLFTVNPVSGARGEIVINAAWGLGEAIVSGRVTPDTIVVEKKSGQIKEVVVADKKVMTAYAAEGAVEREVSSEQRTARVLNDEHIGRLVKIGCAVEAHYRAPQDIEWCLEGGEFFLVQARPVTALPVSAEEIEVARQEEIQRLTKTAGGQPVVWAIHNLAETLSIPTTLTWDVVRRFMSGDGGFGAMYRDFGYRPSAEVCRDGMLELICGRIYVDPRRAAGLFSSGLPMEYDMEAVRNDYRVLDLAPAILNMQKIDPLFFLRLPRTVWSMLRCGKKLKRARAQALHNFKNEALPRFLAYVEQARAQRVTGLSTGQLLEELQRRRHIVLNDFLKESLKPGFFGGAAQGELKALLIQLMGERRGEDLTLQLTTALENDTTIEQSVALFRVARDEMPMPEFLKVYGHRAVNEMELAQPRWREDPEPLKKMFAGYRAKGIVPPEERHARQRAVRLQAEAELPGQLAEFGGSSFQEQVQALLKEAQELLPCRESGKHYLMMGYETIRGAIVELARRWNLGRDIFFLELDELGRFESARPELEARIAERKSRWQAFHKLTPAGVVDSAQLNRLGIPPVREKTAGKLHLTARPIASGLGKGIARVVFDPTLAGDIGTDYILVCPSTDPGWTPLFVNARGLIVEHGGVLSHGAIVARDFGIPAVVCEDATRLISTGMRLELDGSRGVIAEAD